MSLLDVILSAHQDIAAAEDGDAYKLYECLHDIAGQIACADAFYICLYREEDQSLFFPYNYDDEVYDPPSTYPLGDGPTSLAILRNEAVVWNTAEEAWQTNNIHFGNLESFTLSAVHAPIRKPRNGLEGVPIGVLSAHSYRPGVYGPLEVKAYQWLADRAGAALMRAQSQSRETELQCQVAWITEQCVQMINHIRTDAQAIQTLAPSEDGPLRDALFAMIRTCHRSQTDINQLPLRSQQMSRLAGTPLPPAPGSFLSLVTAREREILRLLATGHTYDEISQQLFITTNTVKDHLKRIYSKLGVRNRYEAARMFRAAG